MLSRIIFYRAYKLLPIPVRRTISYLFSNRCSIEIVAYVVKEYQLLLQKHTYQAPWALPCGWLKKDLSFEASIQQEVKKNTGLDIHVYNAMQIINLKGLSVIDIAVLCEVTDGRLKVNHKEITEAAFFDFDNLPSNILHPHKLYILDFMETWHVGHSSRELNIEGRASTSQSARPVRDRRVVSGTKHLQQDHILPAERVVH